MECVRNTCMCLIRENDDTFVTFTHEMNEQETHEKLNNKYLHLYTKITKFNLGEQWQELIS